MKKLRMIVTSAIVFAIVGSAFAFNAKKSGNFCVSTDANFSCDLILEDQQITPGNPTHNYFNGWPGSQSTCVGTNNCTTAVRLIPN